MLDVSNWYRLTKYGIEPLSQKTSGIPIRRNRTCMPPFVTASATALARPPVMTWFSAVTTRGMRRNNAITPSTSNGLALTCSRAACALGGWFVHCPSARAVIRPVLIIAHHCRRKAASPCLVQIDIGGSCYWNLSVIAHVDWARMLRNHWDDLSQLASQGSITVRLESIA